jgi:ABC-2 type transport system permease protein
MIMSPTLTFHQLRWQVLRNSMRLLMTHSLVRLITILACSLLIWGLVFGLSWAGFRELRVRWNVDLDLRVIELVLDMLFLTLSVMLTFSTGIILYSGLFASAESQFLLSLPVPDDHVFAYKLQGSMAFSSWAFVLLGSPVLIAYGIEMGDAGAPWYYYLVMPLLFLGFVLMPGSLGAIACLALVNFLPRRRRQVLVVLLVLLFAGICLLAYSSYRELSQTASFTRNWFEDVLRRLSIVGGSLVPFQWVARALKLAAVGRPLDMLWYFALVWTNGLMAYVVTLWLGRRLFRRGVNRVASGGTLRRRYGGAWLDALVTLLLFFLSPQTRLLIVKDFRTFRRDPAQWVQILIFLGLAAFYFSNVRGFYEQEMARSFKNFISLLTLTASSLLMCAYTGRFIYPMLSLEGRKFWILGLLPLDRAGLVWGKFAFSATGCLLAGEFLAIFSNLMLHMPLSVAATHALTVAILSLGLSGLSVGIGACLPTFNETDPSKIAMGFGGMLNVIAGLLLLLVVITLMALPVHLLYMRDPDASLPFTELPWWVWAPQLVGIALGIVATVLPLRAGYRAMRGMEF